MKIALGLALLASGAPLSAQAYQCRVPKAVSVPQVHPDGPVRQSRPTGYTLALSWSPEFCNGRGARAAGAFQCSTRNGRFGLVVHGLWPEARGTWPQWCPTARKLSSVEARRNMCLVPSPRLQATEWAKHGACMVRTPEAYFKVTRILFNGLRLPDLDRLSKDPELSAGLLRHRFAAANPGWRPEAVGVKLNQRGWLEELRLCYGKDFMPARCDRRRFGPADAAPIKIWRGL
ncbi:ribonuclease T(2) [Tsuneonella deserti]|uniref:Ribonuclease T(2) n=1 Tax=Tsuneonella deserti TaxID=2035528 RepID=A0ABQ1SDT8_9SPHN|nr:ribonuclease T [Tsuneonella deserti]GGE04473.1 ribonuclease T(2) [Tsuneonella deserti]